MTWWRQVGHVFRRDLERTWVSFLVYVVLLGIAVARSVEWKDMMGDSNVPVGVLVMLSAMTVIARAVLADGTTKPDVFWAIQPLESSAVAGSKLLYLALLIVLCCLAVLVSSTAWDLNAVDLQSSGRGVFPNFTLVLFGVALVASVSMDVTRVVVVLVATEVLYLAAVFSTGGWKGEVPPAIRWTLAAILTSASVMILARRYVQRGESRLVRGATFSSGVLAMLFPALTLSTRMSGVMAATDGGATAAVALRVPLTVQPACAGGRLTIPLEVVSPTWWKVELLQPSLKVTLVDGSHVALAADDWMQGMGVFGPMLPEGWDSDGLQLLGEKGDPGHRLTEIEFAMPPTVSARVCGQVAQVELRARMKVATGREVLRAPVVGGASAEAPGYRARISGVDLRDTKGVIRGEISMLRPESRSPLDDMASLEYALVNRERHEIVRVHDHSLDDGSSVAELPGIRHLKGRFELRVFDRVGGRSLGLEAWRDHAELLVTAPVWKPWEWRTATAVLAPRAP